MVWPSLILSRSLALGHQYSSLGSQPILCGSIPGLVPKQLRFCRNYIEIMPSVAEGVKIGIQECQHQFRGRRWNCTTVNDNLAIFGPVLDKGISSWHSQARSEWRNTNTHLPFGGRGGGSENRKKKLLFGEMLTLWNRTIFCWVAPSKINQNGYG